MICTVESALTSTFTNRCHTMKCLCWKLAVGGTVCDSRFIVYGPIVLHDGLRTRCLSNRQAYGNVGKRNDNRGDPGGCTMLTFYGSLVRTWYIRTASVVGDCVYMTYVRISRPALILSYACAPVRAALFVVGDCIYMTACVPGVGVRR